MSSARVVKQEKLYIYTVSDAARFASLQPGAQGLQCPQAALETAMAITAEAKPPPARVARLLGTALLLLASKHSLAVWKHFELIVEIPLREEIFAACLTASASRICWAA
jgi:hypothetical protein